MKGKERQEKKERKVETYPRPRWHTGTGGYMHATDNVGGRRGGLLQALELWLGAETDVQFKLWNEADWASFCANGCLFPLAWILDWQT